MLSHIHIYLFFSILKTIYHINISSEWKKVRKCNRKKHNLEPYQIINCRYAVLCPCSTADMGKRGSPPVQNIQQFNYLLFEQLTELEPMKTRRMMLHCDGKKTTYFPAKRSERLLAIFFQDLKCATLYHFNYLNYK